MTHAIYTYQQLQLKSIARLKQIYSEIACTVEVADKRCKDAWITAIADYQASKVQKLISATPDEQTTAQAELDVTAQAQAIAPEELTTVEISFYDHEFYAGLKLIASITHDDDLTQPWLVIVNGIEKFRANTWMRCYRYISWHHQDGTLNEPVPAQTEAPSITENEIMAQIFNECEKYGFEILDDGIYRDDIKLGEVGHTDAGWWFTRAADAIQQRIPCNSAMDAVYWLSMVDTMPHAEAADYEEMLDRPFEMLTNEEWGQLRQLVTA
ncbi:MAG: hypothetical protein V7K32_15525 [Nostoc sp.]|uniref:hypothetical protein n=1 Tax=Nostoc sp. TaxID=1180 RepID=UPI002FF8AE04